LNPIWGPGKTTLKKQGGYKHSLRGEEETWERIPTKGEKETRREQGIGGNRVTVEDCLMSSIG